MEVGFQIKEKNIAWTSLYAYFMVENIVQDSSPSYVTYSSNILYFQYTNFLLRMRSLTTTNILSYECLSKGT